MPKFDHPLKPISYKHLSIDDRLRILESGALAAELHDGVARLYQYLLPNGKIFAHEEKRNGRVVLGETKNLLMEWVLERRVAA